MTSRLPLGIALAVLCFPAAGCQEKSAPASAAAPALTHDQQILQALDSYDPMYKLDAKGRVIRLRLGWRNLPDSVLAEIDKLTELKGMDLAGSSLTDDGLAQLKDLHKLRSIGLGNTLITDKALEHLEKLPSLRWVWMSKKTISQEAVDNLKSARPEMNIYLN